MRKFIFKLVSYLLVCLFFLIVYIIEFDVLKNPHSQIGLFKNDLGSVRTMITGTSHTLDGFNSNLLDLKAINISDHDKPIVIDLEIIRKNFEVMPNLQFIVIPIDYFTLFYSGESNACAERFRHHWGLELKERMSLHFLNCKIVTPIELCMPNNKELSNFNPLMGIFNSAEADGAITDRIDVWHKHWMSLRNYQMIRIELQEFVDFCNSKNMKIIFVQMPLSLVLRKKLNAKYSRLTTQSLDYFHKFSNTYFIDYNDYTIFNNDSLFNDCDHLNLKGAILASEILNNEINKIATKLRHISPGLN